MTATELAHSADVSPQTASSHLSQMLVGTLVTLEKQGRHRYYRLANAEVATAIEALMSLAPVETVHQTQPLEPVHLARRCYDHVAGRVGVALADAFQEKDWLSARGKDFVVTQKGDKAFEAWGIDLGSLKKQRRHLARQCLDWTERRPHVAGALGAALMTCLLEREWLGKDDKTRVLHVTNAGFEGFEEAFGIKLYGAVSSLAHPR